MKCLTDFSGSGLALNRQVHLVFSLLLASCFLFWLFTAVFLIYTWVMALQNGGKGTQEESAAAMWLGSHSQSLVPLTVQQALHIHAQLNDSSHQCCLQTFLLKTTLLSLQKQRIYDSIVSRLQSCDGWKNSLIKSQDQLYSRGLLFPIRGDQGISFFLLIFLILKGRVYRW